MKIKLDFNNWMKFTLKINSYVPDAVNTKVDWESMGLKELLTDANDGLAMHFDVVDEKKFFLVVVDYGLEYTKSEK